MSLGSNTPGNRTESVPSSTLLSRLRRDQKGNALAIVAASVIPLVGAIGGGVDLTRAYMAEARLAQACDAAALAGRKVMTNKHVNGDGAVIAGSVADQEIQKFLNYNFPQGKFETGTITRTAQVNDDGELNITLATTMPTQLLRIAGVQSMSLSADCAARRSGVNVDVVLVLDVTGSMAYDIDKNSGTKNERLKELQSATLSFLDTLDSLRTQLAASGMRVRVGVVPYSQTVNVGLDLPEEYINAGSNISTENPQYYSRIPLPRKSGTTWYNTTTNNGSTVQGETGKIGLDLRNFVTRGRNSTGHTNAYNWKGCVEMRKTVQTINSSTSLDSIPAGAWDIRDVAPGTDGAPKWQPYISLPTAGDSKTEYGPPTSGAAKDDTTFQKVSAETDRYNRVPYRITNKTTGPTTPDSAATGLNPTDKGPNLYCTDRVKLLDSYTKDDLESYINDLSLGYYTYHDAGMYWGLALISPQAPFENPNTYLAPGFTGEERSVNRYIVFMTDGALQPDASYSAWGREGSGLSSNAMNHTVTSGSSLNAHRRRFRLICEEAKRTGVEIYAVAFAKGVGTDDETALKKCASSEESPHYTKAEKKGELEDVFQKIAQNIGYLRVSR